MAFARFWEWERAVKEELPRLIADGGIQVIFQPIFRLSEDLPSAVGFEALSRFPVAPRIPIGLWFRTAREMGLIRQLELAAIHAAVASLTKVSDEAFLCVNASVGTVPQLMKMVPGELTDRLIVDLPYSALRDPRSEDVFRLLRRGAAGVCIDDVPVEDLHVLRPTLRELGPDCIKVDALNGLAGNPMARFNLAQGAAWCQSAGIELIAERVEHAADLVVLTEVGVEWAQGYCLSRPVLL